MTWNSFAQKSTKGRSFLCYRIRIPTPKRDRWPLSDRIQRSRNVFVRQAHALPINNSPVRSTSTINRSLPKYHSISPKINAPPNSHFARFYMYFVPENTYQTPPKNKYQENKLRTKEGYSQSVLSPIQSPRQGPSLPSIVCIVSPQIFFFYPLQLRTSPDSIVRHLTGTQCTSLHRRRWRRLLGPRRRRWWRRLLPRRPVSVRVLRPARRAPVTVTIAVTRIAHLAVCVLEHVRAVAAVLGLRGAEIEAHVGDLRRVCWHTAQRAHVGWCAGAIAERGWSFETGL